MGILVGNRKGGQFIPNSCENGCDGAGTQVSGCHWTGSGDPTTNGKHARAFEYIHADLCGVRFPGVWRTGGLRDDAGGVCGFPAALAVCGAGDGAQGDAAAYFVADRVCPPAPRPRTLPGLRTWVFPSDVDLLSFELRSDGIVALMRVVLLLAGAHGFQLLEDFLRGADGGASPGLSVCAASLPILGLVGR